MVQLNIWSWKKRHPSDKEREVAKRWLEIIRATLRDSKTGKEYHANNKGDKNEQR